MAYATQSSAISASTGRRAAQRRASTPAARGRSWLRDLSTRLAWMLVARHGFRHGYCPVYRSSLAVLLHGLARDVALTHLCQPVHCYSHATSLAWESSVALKRSPLLKR